MNSRSFESLRLAVLHAAFLAEVRRLRSASRSGRVVRHAPSIIRRVLPISRPRGDARRHRHAGASSARDVQRHGRAVRRARRSTRAFRAWLARDDAGRRSIAPGWSETATRRDRRAAAASPSCRGRRARATGHRLAFVYNVYTEPAHRRRGLARLIMDAIHAWCREEGIGSMALNASPTASRSTSRWATPCRPAR